jgi:hypothetical protein
MLRRRRPAGHEGLAFEATGKLRHHSINLNFRPKTGRHMAGTKPVDDA